MRPIVRVMSGPLIGLISLFLAFENKAEDETPAQVQKSKTYSMKDLAMTMTNEEIEVMVEEIQDQGRLMRKLTWQGKDYFISLKNPQDSAASASAQWECSNSENWKKVRLPRADKAARVEAAVPISKKVKVYAETLRTTCYDRKQAQARPRVEDSNIGLKTGDASKGERERRLFVNPQENSFNLGTSF